mmetsp:Transcript_74286/g.240260  ORF Transcript_74286/g.240260 Transcript_74286/m.240260 type:complete len:232 (+) Transcript_74286:1991-2686(+)
MSITWWSALRQRCSVQPWASAVTATACRRGLCCAVFGSSWRSYHIVGSSGGCLKAPFAVLQPSSSVSRRCSGSSAPRQFSMPLASGRSRPRSRRPNCGSSSAWCTSPLRFPWKCRGKCAGCWTDTSALCSWMVTCPSTKAQPLSLSRRSVCSPSLGMPWEQVPRRAWTPVTCRHRFRRLRRRRNGPWCHGTVQAWPRRRKGHRELLRNCRAGAPPARSLALKSCRTTPLRP